MFRHSSILALVHFFILTALWEPHTLLEYFSILAPRLTPSSCRIPLVRPAAAGPTVADSYPLFHCHTLLSTFIHLRPFSFCFLAIKKCFELDICSGAHSNFAHLSFPVSIEWPIFPPLNGKSFCQKTLSRRGVRPPSPLTESPQSFSRKFLPKRTKNDVFLH